MHSLKEYTLNNTWVDLDVEVYTDSQGTSGSRIEKQKEMTGLMAGDVMRFRKDWSTKEDRERNLQSN